MNERLKKKEWYRKSLLFFLAAVIIFSSLSLIAANEKKRSSNIIYWNTAASYAHKEVEGIAVSYLMQMDHKEMRHRFTIVDGEDGHHRIDFDAQSGRMTRNYPYEPKNNYAPQYRKAKVSLEEIIQIVSRSYPSALVVKADLVGKSDPLAYEVELYDRYGKVLYVTMSAEDGSTLAEKGQESIAGYEAKISRWEAEKLAREMTSTKGGKIVSTKLVEQGGLYHYVTLHMSKEGVFHETGINAENGEMVYTRMPD